MCKGAGVDPTIQKSRMPMRRFGAVGMVGVESLEYCMNKCGKKRKLYGVR